MTSTPSMSGKPKSRIRMSGLCDAASISVLAPQSASRHLYPWVSSDTFRKLRIDFSSSAIRIKGCIDMYLLGRNPELHSSAMWLIITERYLPTVGFDN